MSREQIILWTLLGYKILLLLLGWWGQRRTNTETDFLLAGRRMGAAVAAISSAASSSSAWTILGVSGFAYTFGLSAIWLAPGCIGGFLLNWYVLAPRLRRYSERHGSLTVTDVIAGPITQERSRQIRVFATVVILGSLGIYVGSQFQASGLTFHRIIPDLGAEQGIVIGAVIIVAYTMMGGFWAASLTDTLQGLMMAGTAIVLPTVAYMEVAETGGFTEGIAQVQTAGFQSFTGAWEMPALFGFVLGILGIGLGYPGQPHVVNRIMALKDDGATLRRARVIAITWAVVVYGGMLMLGWCGRVLFPTTDNSEAMFLDATTELFAPIPAGIMIAALLSAIMSTADSQLLAAGAALTHDLSPDQGDSRRLVWRSRIGVLLVGAIATISAIAIDQNIFNKVLFAWGVLGATFGPVLLVILFAARVPANARLASMAVGCSLSLVTYVCGLALKLGKEWDYMERVVPFVAALFTCMLLSRSASAEHHSA